MKTAKDIAFEKFIISFYESIQNFSSKYEENSQITNFLNQIREEAKNITPKCYFLLEKRLKKI